MINVTKTYLPNKAKYQAYIDRIYESGWLTNNGHLFKELEVRFKKYLGVNLEDFSLSATNTYGRSKLINEINLKVAYEH